MSGLFHRLARQVVGPEPTRVHAMERLPFAPLADMETPVEAIVASTNERPVATAPSSARREQARPAGAPETQSPTANGRRTEPNRYAAPKGDFPYPDSPRPKSAGAESVEAFSLLPPTTIHDETTTAPQATTRSRGDAGGKNESATGHAEDKLRFGVPAPIVEVPMAAPETLDHSPAAQRWGPVYGEPGDWSSRPGASGADEPTEVHVHIGRIEVTATHEPAPPKRKAGTGRKPMSLDEYLARRQRGRP